ncbi:MAG: tape measure protein [Patescibacteria group bacterium]
MAESRIGVVVTAEDLASTEIERLKANVSSMRESVEKNSSGVKSSMEGISFAIKGVVASALSIGAAFNAVKAAADFEQTSISFQTMLGDVGQAQALLQQLSDFAAATPFEFPEIATAGKQLLAFGVAADQIKGTLTTLGDIASGVSVPIGQLTNVFGQVKAAGKLMGQDLLQFTSAGIPIIEALGKTLGKSSSEIKGMVEKGKVGFPDVQRALESLTAEGGKFHNMMAKQSTSLGGLWSTLSDTFGNLSRNIVGISTTGEVRVGSLFDKLRTWAAGLIETINKMTPAIIDFANDFQTYFSVALGSVGEMWRAEGELVIDILSIFDSSVKDSTVLQTFHWRDLFAYMTSGFAITSLGFVSTLKIIQAVGKTLITGLRVTAEEFTGFVVLTIA